MSQLEFYPYPTAGEGIAFTCHTDDERVVLEDRRIVLEGVPDGESVELSLEAQIEDGVLERILHPSEFREPPVRLLVLAKSLPSRMRRAVELSLKDGTWHGEIGLQKSDLYRHATLEPVLTRSAPGQHLGFARHLGARLAWGPRFEVEVDEAPVPPGGFLEIKWDEFASSANRQRKDNPGLLYLLDTEASPPMLWLNSGAHDEFKAVMHAKGPRGRNMRIRDAMFDTIVCQVWTSLVSIVLTRLAAAMTEEDDVLAATESLTDWETRVLHFWAPRLAPDAGTKGEAIGDVVADAASHELMPALQERLGIAVQHLRTAHAFQGLIRLRDGEGV